MSENKRLSSGAIERYVVTFQVESDASPIDIAAAVAIAVDFQHVGAITVAPATTYSWEDPVV